MRRSKKLSRRELLSRTIATSIACSISGPSKAFAQPPGAYEGKCVVSLMLDGGADPTQFCDPKTNTPGERKINNWADNDEPRQIGNITFAPIADNEWLLSRFGADMLVINGVDYGTNSHTTGKMYAKTGSNAEGKPSVTALHAANTTPDLPLAFSLFSGVARTSGLIQHNQFSNLKKLRALARPHYRDSMYISNADLNALKRGQDELDTVASLSQLTAEWRGRSLSTARQQAAFTRYESSKQGAELLGSIAEILPPDGDIVSEEQFSVLLPGGPRKLYSDAKKQMQGALLVLKSGLGSAVDISLDGFDTHDGHDAQHEVLYTHLADALDFFWNYAEELGIADRILLVIGSDFGRTNFYNDGEGKDHWPVGSSIIMERNAPWGNRVVGLTDELHFAKRINPTTLREDPTGVIITPAHVHKALQNYLGLDTFAEDMGLDLKGVETLPLFDSSLQSVGGLSPYARGIW